MMTVHYFEFVLQKNTRVPCKGLLLYVNLKVFKQQGHSPFLDNIFKYSYPSLVISSSLPIIFTLSFNKIFECLFHKKYIYLGFLPSFILASRAVKISFHMYDKNVPPPSVLIYFNHQKLYNIIFVRRYNFLSFIFFFTLLLSLLFLSIDFHFFFFS